MASQETKSQNPFETPAAPPPVPPPAREPTQTVNPKRPLAPRRLISTDTKKPVVEQQEREEARALQRQLEEAEEAAARARALEEARALQRQLEEAEEARVRALEEAEAALQRQLVEAREEAAARARAAERDGGVPQPPGMRLGRARARSDERSLRHAPGEEKVDSGVDEKSDGGSYSEEEEAPAADNASSSVWANVKEIFNIRFNPLSGEALSRMYQQPAQRTATQKTATATQPPTTQTQPPTTTQRQPPPPPTTIATQTQPPTTTQTEVAPAIPGMDSLIVAMQDLNDSVMTSKGELSKAVADAAEAISKSVDAANKPPQPSKTSQPPQTSQTSQPPQPQTKESQQERMLRAIENINLQNRIGGGGGGCGVGLNSLGNVGLIGRLTEKSPNTVDVATKVLEAAVLGENTLTTNILNQREKLNQDVQNKSRELDRLLKTREREEMELALSTELADMQKEYSNATKRMKKDTTEKEKMLVKYAKELQLKDEERRVETNAAVEAMIETYRDEFEKALKESEKGIYSKVFGEAEEILRKKLRDQQVALEEDGRALNNDIREACTGREEDLVTNVYEAVTSPEDPCLSEVERMVLEHSRREAGLDADVLMYTQPDCAACDEARDMLEDQNIKYISFDLSEAPDFAALVEDQPKPMMFRVSGPMPEWISWESMRDFR